MPTGIKLQQTFIISSLNNQNIKKTIGYYYCSEIMENFPKILFKKFQNKKFLNNLSFIIIEKYLWTENYRKIALDLNNDEL